MPWSTTQILLPQLPLLHTLPLQEGAVNLAPYSFFNVFGADPPVVAIGMARSMPRKGAKKDTLNNIEATG
jgi:flavin reductase (DIM6/NTAB) family NADH-FMN oxidoreductase RutF